MRRWCIRDSNEERRGWSRDEDEKDHEREIKASVSTFTWLFSLNRLSFRVSQLQYNRNLTHKTWHQSETRGSHALKRLSYNSPLFLTAISVLSHNSVFVISTWTPEGETTKISWVNDLLTVTLNPSFIQHWRVREILKLTFCVIRIADKNNRQQSRCSLTRNLLKVINLDWLTFDEEEATTDKKEGTHPFLQEKEEEALQREGLSESSSSTDRIRDRRLDHLVSFRYLSMFFLVSLTGHQIQ